MNETILNGQSADIVSENIQKLKQIFPEVFCEESIDFEKLQAVLGEYSNDDKERYNFTWWGKSQALRLAQTPSMGTLRPCKEESKDWDTTENLYIEGDNLEVLKLLQKSYHSKIKMIYIDPPYNTGNDFVYKDDYKDPLKNYLEMTGQVNEGGEKVSTNSEASGRYHTNWLNMMYPRLRLARNLLRDDGVIFISIDDNESDNLRKLCSEVFGEVNFVAGLVWKKRVSPANDSKWYSSDHEYIFVYAKEKEKWNPNKTKRTKEHNKYYTNPDNDPRGPWNSAAYTCNKSKSQRPNLYYPIQNPNTGEEIWPNENAVWAYSTNTHFQHVEDNIIYWGGDGKSSSPRKKQFLSNAKPVVPRSVWDYQEVGSTQTATIESRELFGGASFSYPKSVGVLLKLIFQGTSDNNYVLDFFSGSATSAHATIQLNSEDGAERKFIMVQFPEITEEKSEAHKAGYKNICEIGKERIRRAGEKIKSELQEQQSKQASLLGNDETVNPEDLDIGFKVFKLDSSNLKKWNPDYENVEASLLDSIENYVEGRSELDVVYEIMLKYGIDLTLPIEEFKIGGKKIYSIGYGALIICLDQDITTDVANEIIRLKDKLKPEVIRVVFKDNGFKNDSAKTNTKEILRNAGIDEIVSI